MSTGAPPLVLTLTEGMDLVGRQEWDALAHTAPDPFLEWEWLALLEHSGSATPERGWRPLHAALRRQGRLVAAAPLYLKSHSEGEYVFDQVFAEAARRLGVAYYPKLVAVSPFTPASGRRLLTAPDMPEDEAARAMLAGLDRLCLQNGFSGLHFLFVEQSQARLLVRNGCRAWTHQGYLWENPGYADFEDWLATLNANRRKTIRRERRDLARAGVVTRLIEGPDAPESFFPLMYALYEKTNDQFGEYSCKYLTREFFEGLAGDLRKRLVFAAAYLPGQSEPVGLSLLARKNDRLWGRYWGCARDVPFLHFELCYYAPIQWAIQHGARTYDPGMGGEHKARRGFVSRPTYSLHRLHDPVLAELFDRHLDAVNAMETDYLQSLNRLRPLRRG